MKDFDEPGHLAPTGLILGGTKYMVIQGEPGAVIRGKKVVTACQPLSRRGCSAPSSPTRSVPVLTTIVFFCLSVLVPRDPGASL
jgi:hypothetical protein